MYPTEGVSRARPDGLGTQGLVVVRKSDRAARRSDRRSQVGPQPVCCTSSSSGSPRKRRNQSHRYTVAFVILARQWKRQEQHAEPFRPRSDTFLELTLVVANGPAYTGMRLETVTVSSGLGLPLRSAPPVCYASATSQARRQRASPF